MIRVGQKVKFDAFGHMSQESIMKEHLFVVGTVVYVNEKHKWFSVEYGAPVSRDSFQFADIGKVVEVCG